MKAYEGIITKEEFIKEIKWHKEQDNFIQGEWFYNGKGCAVGCSLESIARTKKINLSYDDFEQYPELLGIPEWIARLEEKIFEGLSEKDAAQWVLDFSEAISTGQDLNKIEIPFKIWLQEENIKRVRGLEYLDINVKKKVISAIKKVIESLRINTESAAELARSAAKSAAWSAKSAAELAWSAWSAARSAKSAAWSAESAAWSARSATWSAESAAYKEMASKLLKLIKENK